MSVREVEGRREAGCPPRAASWNRRFSVSGRCQSPRTSAWSTTSSGTSVRRAARWGTDPGTQRRRRARTPGSTSTGRAALSRRRPLPPSLRLVRTRPQFAVCRGRVRMAPRDRTPVVARRACRNPSIGVARGPPNRSDKTVSAVEVGALHHDPRPVRVLMTHNSPAVPTPRTATDPRPQLRRDHPASTG